MIESIYRTEHLQTRYGYEEESVAVGLVVYGIKLFAEGDRLYHRPDFHQITHKGGIRSL